MRADVKIRTKGGARIPNHVEVDGHDLTEYCQQAVVNYPAGEPPRLVLTMFCKDIDIQHEDENGNVVETLTTKQEKTVRNCVEKLRDDPRNQEPEMVADVLEGLLS